MSGRRSKKLRKRLGLVWGCTVALFLVPIAALVAVLFTETGTRLVLDRALIWYNDTIAGSVNVASIRGSLGDRFELGGASLKDGTGKRLVGIDRISLRWDPLALLSGKLDVQALSLRGVEVCLADNAEKNPYADIVPEAAASDAPGPGLGPDLPLQIDVAFSIDGFSLIASGADSTKDLVSNARVVGKLTAKGRRAELRARHVSGRLPELDLDVTALALNATWQEPTVRLEKLALRSNRGDIFAHDVTVDLSQVQGKARINARLDRAFITRAHNIELPVDPHIDISLTGDLEDFRATASISLKDKSDLTAMIQGSVTQGIDLNAAIQLSNLDPSVGAQTLPGAITGRGEVRAKGSAFATATIDGSFQCDKCVIWPVGSVDGGLTVHFEAGAGQARVSLDAAGLSLQTKAAFEDWVPRDFSWHVASDDLSRPSTALAEVAPLPLLKGRLNGAGQCERSAEGDLRCAGKILASRLKSPWSTARSVRLDFKAAPLAASRPFSGTVRGRGVHLSGQKITGIAVGFQGTSERIEMTGSARLGQGHRLKTRLAFSPGQPFRLDIEQLVARRRTLVARLLGPVTIQADERGFHVDQLSIRVAGGFLRATARVVKEGQSDLHLTADQLDLGHVTAIFPWLGLEGTVHTQVRLAGSRSALTGTVRTELDRLKYKDVHLGTAAFKADYSGDVLDAELTAADGPARFMNAKVRVGVRLDLENGRAHLNNNRPLRLSLEAKDLRLDAISAWFPEAEISGLTDANVHINGSPHGPSISSSIRARELAWRGIAIDTATADVSFAKQLAGVQLDIKGGVASGINARGSLPIHIDVTKGITWMAGQPHEIDMDIAGLDFKALADALSAAMPNTAVPVLHLKGQADIQVQLRGAPASPELDVYAALKKLGWGDRDIGVGAIGFQSRGGSADLHAQITQRAGRYVDLKGSFPLPMDLERFTAHWRPKGVHEIAILVAGIDGALAAPFIDLPAGLDFRINGSIKGSGSVERFLLNGTLDGELRQRGFVHLPVRGALRASHEDQSVHISVGPKTNPLLLAQGRAGLTRGDVLAEGFNVAKTPLSARIDIPGLDIAPFSRLLPTAFYKAEGTVKGQVIADGTIARPSIQGWIALEQGAVTIAELNQRLQQVGVTVALDGVRARISELTFSSGKGQGTGALEAIYLGDGRVQGQGEIDLDRFPFVKPGIPEGLIDSNMQVRFEHAPERTDVAVAFRDTNLRLLQTTGSRVPRGIQASDSLVFVDPRDVQAKQKKQRGKALLPETAHQLHLTVDMTDPTEIRGRGVEMRWAGKLLVVSAAGTNDIKGKIRAFPGRFQFLGNTFEIESGEITLPVSGELDPFVHIVAGAMTPEAQVTVTVRGRASRPELMLTSDPAMSQYEIVSLLVTGKSDTAEQGDEDVQTKAASLLLAFQNPTLERQLYSRLGLDKVDVKLGRSVEEPIVVVGKRLGKRLYVETEYHHNAPPDENTTGARVEYRLSPSWSVESAYGDAQKGEVGIYWRKRFDAPSRDRDADGVSEEDTEQ